MATVYFIAINNRGQRPLIILSVIKIGFKNLIAYDRYKGRQGKVQKQARKGTKAGMERYKGRQGKVQMQAREGTQSDKERDKGRE